MRSLIRAPSRPIATFRRAPHYVQRTYVIRIQGKASAENPSIRARALGYSATNRLEGRLVVNGEVQQVRRLLVCVDLLPHLRCRRCPHRRYRVVVAWVLLIEVLIDE